MAHENFYDPHEQFWGWRCILCGEIVDQVILKNRKWTKKGGERRKEEETEEEVEEKSEGEDEDDGEVKPGGIE